MTIGVQVACLCDILARRIKKAAAVMDDETIPAERRAAARRSHAGASKQLADIQAVMDGKRDFVLIGAAEERPPSPFPAACLP